MAFVDWGSCVVNGAATLDCIVPLFQNVVKSLIALSGMALLVMLFIGGFNFLFSAGDGKKLEAARGTITNAVIGLVIIVLAYVILRTIYAFTGVDVTTFKIVM